MTFEEIIVKYRKQLGLTQEGLAQKLGVTNQAVSKWESGLSCPDIALLPKIADLFGITMDELFGREMPKQETKALPWPDDGAVRMVLFAGHRHIAAADPTAREFHFCYEGPALDVHSAVNVTCEAVNGSVTAGGEVSCEAVYGSVRAGGCVNCEDVYGSVDAQGDVNCEDVSGNVTANGEVNCADVGGDVSAGGDVNCECVDGDVHAGGDVNCDEASGNITAGGDVNCDHWEM